MNENKEDILQKIQDAEMILIGIGEEFNNVKALRQRKDYNECRQMLAENEVEWLVPALNYYMCKKEKDDIYNVLGKFAELIAEKNYYVVSVSTNEVIRDIPWKENRLVMPCGGSLFKQCVNRCKVGLTQVTENDWNVMNDYIKKCIVSDSITDESSYLGVCPECGSPLILNNIYTENYDENGYLEQWNIYTKWLQGTLNRKLLVLELGVGMQCPTVIRWPFEKITFFNQKATFIRINENLYQLSEEIKGKGQSISQNAIEWLRFLC